MDATTLGPTFTAALAMIPAMVVVAAGLFAAMLVWVSR